MQFRIYACRLRDECSLILVACFIAKIYRKKHILSNSIFALKELRWVTLMTRRSRDDGLVYIHCGKYLRQNKHFTFIFHLKRLYFFFIVRLMRKIYRYIFCAFYNLNMHFIFVFSLILSLLLLVPWYQTNMKKVLFSVSFLNFVCRDTLNNFLLCDCNRLLYSFLA